MTITHPYHPWVGQSVKVIYVQHGIDPDMLVQRPDGRHVLMAMSWTDYAGTRDDTLPFDPPPLPDMGGLCQAVRLIERIRTTKNTP